METYKNKQLLIIVCDSCFEIYVELKIINILV